MWSAALQVVALAALAVEAQRVEHRAATVFGLATAYWAGGLATGPAWNTWMEKRIPSRVRARYFGRRTRLTQACVLAGLVAAGLWLQLHAGDERDTRPFSALFAGAAVCRAVSVWFLSTTGEDPLDPARVELVRPRRRLARLGDATGARFLLYMVAVQVAVQLSGPYFTPYMLVELDLSYGGYLVLIATAYLTRVLVSPLLGEQARRRGAWWLLLVGGVGIVPTALLWTFSDAYAWLIAIQVYAGLAWASYELAQTLLVFEAVPRAERTSILALYNVANASAMALGGLLGGAALTGAGISVHGYHLLFLLSTFARAGCLLLLIGLHARTVRTPDVIGTRTVALRPGAGAIDRPVLATLDVEEP